jgi:hypothetical protein
MTANELASEVEDWEYEIGTTFSKKVATMLRQQAEEIENLRKELALQRLSDISQEIENRESAIHATGYWKGVEYKRMCELTDEEIMVLYEEYIETQYVSESNVLSFGRAILKKASEK